MLEFKKIPLETRSAMRDAVGSDYDYYSKTVKCINELVSSGDVYVLNSANSCLIALAESINDPILVCDMGGWNGFNKSCELFGKKVEFLSTDDGIINIEILSDYLSHHNVKSLYITSLAGYTAPQPLSKIQELCALHEVLLIIDISPSLGDRNMTKYGDLLVSSTGSPKIVNIENGGFICNRTGKITLNQHMLKSFKADKITCAGIAEELVCAEKTLNKTIKMNKYLKKKLEDNNIETVHPTKYGLNTIIPAPSKKRAKQLAYNIRQQLNIDGNIITVGPNYNRIKRASIVIETKNLDTTSLNYEDMNYLCNIIINEIKKEKESK